LHLFSGSKFSGRGRGYVVMYVVTYKATSRVTYHKYHSVKCHSCENFLKYLHFVDRASCNDSW